MSLNYNQALFRNLRKPMVEGLGRVAGEAGEVAKGAHDGTTMASLEDARTLVGSLTMIGCGALERLAAVLINALEHIQEAPSYGWDELHTRKVAQATATLALGLIPQVERMADGEATLPVRLWPPMRALYELMNEAVPAPETLFEPDPDLDDITFRRLDTEHLARVVGGAIVRLDLAREAIQAATDEASFAAGLAGAYDVFQWTERLNHRRGFQGYWLVLSARLAQAQIDLASSLADPESVRDVLRDAAIELKRFSKDTTKVTGGRVNSAIAPLLRRWPSHWQHPALQKVRDAFALDAFWQALDDLHADPDNPPPGQRFDERREEITQALGNLRNDWGKWLEGTTPVSEVSRRLALFSPLAPLFPQEQATPLIDAMIQLIGWAVERPDEKPDDVLTEELAIAFLTLEDALDARQQGQQELADLLTRQAKRLHALMVPGRPDLGRLPGVKWGNVRRRRATQEARRQTLHQVSHDLEETERWIDKILRDEVEPKDVRQVLANLVPNLDVGAATLETLRLPLHARIQRAVLDRLDLIAGRPALLDDPQESQNLAVALPALMRAVQAAAEGQSDTEEGLSQAAVIFLREEVKGRTDVPELPPLAETSSGAPIAVPAQDAPITEAAASVPSPSVQVLPVQASPTQAPPAQAPWLPSPSADHTTPEVAVQAPDEESLLVATEDDPLRDDAPPPPAGEPETEWSTAPANAGGFAVPVLDAEEEHGEIEPRVAEQDEQARPVDGAPVRPAPDRDVSAALRGEGYNDTTDGEDEELIEAYFEELVTLLSELRTVRDQLQLDPSHAEAWDTLRRAFHTIKGSGRLVGLLGLGEIGWWGEQYVRRLQDAGAIYNGDINNRLARLSAAIEIYAEELQADGQTHIRGRALWDLLNEVPPEANAVPAGDETEVLEGWEDDFELDLAPIRADHAPLTDEEAHAAARALDLGPPAESEAPEPEVPPAVEPLREDPLDDPFSAEAQEMLPAPLTPAEDHSWTVPDADANAHKVVVRDEPPSALALFVADPENYDVLQREWDQRLADLDQIEQTHEARQLELVAHTMRTLASMFHWDAWAGEFAHVERVALDQTAEQMDQWVARWRHLIHQAKVGVETRFEPIEVASEDTAEPGYDEAHQVAADAGRAPAADTPHDPPYGASNLAALAGLDPVRRRPDAHLVPETDEDAEWDEVFAAFDTLMDGGRRLGAALERLARRRDLHE